MASISYRFEENVEGEFYVDSSCINCDTCRQLAPNVFHDQCGYSVVNNQPISENSIRNALYALISCPTGSIGTISANNRKVIRDDFPLNIEENVYYNGFNSPKSFGSNSYLITHPHGNWLIDSPRYSPFLLQKFKNLGGIRYIFLTHRDDVADAKKYAERFDGCERIIHYYDRSAQSDAEIIVKGNSFIQFLPNFLVIPSPGHTRGHMLLLYKNKYLFTGDHLYWRRDWNRLRASKNYCWYDWNKQLESMEKLVDITFEYILPGHGQRIKLPEDKMKKELLWLVNEMKKANYR